MKICKIKNCGNKYLAKGHCSRHYRQIKKHEKNLFRTRFDPNEIIDCGNYCEMNLYNKHGNEKARTKFNKECLEKVKKYKWCLSYYGYVFNTKNKTYLHQVILGKKKGFEIDHINNDTLDNRNENLRFATSSQNKMNRKRLGVSLYKQRKKWVAYISKNKKRISLGYFKSKSDALKVRREAELKYFGRFAFERL